ncbi:MAG: exodeoxyribonuclease III [Candidatus Paceibacterota bacterium]|jgi:exodeoxyribonuclease-3
MRIISWNVNGIRANVKKGGFDWFLNESPDIYFVQETKARAEQLEEGVHNPPGYFSYFDHSKGRNGYSGVAAFTKVKPSKVEYGLGKEQYDQEGRFIGLFYDGLIKDISKLAVLNIYFPNGGGGPVRLKFKLEYYDEFLKYVNSLQKKGYEVIFTGDINTAHNEIDLARPKENAGNTGFLPVERAWLDKVVKNGYVDVFRSLYPTLVGKYTYWDMKTFARERNVGWRIDYFFVTPGLMEKVEKIRILDHVLGSDHCPLELVIR